MVSFSNYPSAAKQTSIDAETPTKLTFMLFRSPLFCPAPARPLASSSRSRSSKCCSLCRNTAPHCKVCRAASTMRLTLIFIFAVAGNLWR